MFDLPSYSLQSEETKTASAETIQKMKDLSALDLDVEGIDMKTNEDGSVSFR